MISGIGNSSQLMSQLFSKLDTKGQGYLEKSDLASAFSKISAKSGGSSDSSNVDDVFSALDSDSNGKVTESEFSSTVSKLLEQLNGQLSQTRQPGAGEHGGPQGMHGSRPPPPPPEGQDGGFTKDELQNQLKEIAGSDSQRSNLISNIVSNFDKADTNSDGKVSFNEAQAFDQSSQSTASSSSNAASDTTSSTSPNSSANNTDAQVMRKIMELMHAYGSAGQDGRSAGLSSLLSVTA